MKMKMLVAIWLMIISFEGIAQTIQIPDSSKALASNKVTAGKKPTPPPAKPKIVLPVPEFINQPYFYDIEGNHLVKLENQTAKMNTHKKTLGLGGAKQYLTIEGISSKIRFTASKNIEFMIKTGGDEIDLTSYVKLYKFNPEKDKREVVLSSNGGILNSKSEEKSSLITLSFKKISTGNYLIVFATPLDAGEYGFLWSNNMSLQEFPVFAFGVDWKKSD